MSTLSYKMLFRKGGTTSAIIAVALLVAILASMSSIVNPINTQAEALGERYLNLGGTFLILSKNSTSLTNSEVDAGLANLIRGIPNVRYALPQRVHIAALTADSGNHTILMREVEDVSRFLTSRKASVNGIIAKGEAEANAGEILARLAGINLGDEVDLTVDNTPLKSKVVGIVKTLTQTDTELIVPMTAINHLTENDSKVSVIEFSLKEDVKGEAILNLTRLLPTDVKVVKAKQLNQFMQDMSGQTLTFLNLWSIAVYAVVAAASYVIVTRLIAESRYELTMIRTLGARRMILFTLILAHVLIVTLLGSTLGIALGTAGTQTASTILMWIRPSIEIKPFLELNQTFLTLLLTLTSSTLGCLYPAFRCAYKRSMEQPL